MQTPRFCSSFLSCLSPRLHFPDTTPCVRLQREGGEDLESQTVTFFSLSLFLTRFVFISWSVPLRREIPTFWKADQSGNWDCLPHPGKHESFTVLELHLCVHPLHFERNAIAIAHTGTVMPHSLAITKRLL